jgi:hypothetical protein
LSCDDNNLLKLEVAANTELFNISCSGNYLDSLDLTNNINFGSLDCSYNSMYKLNLKNGTNLSRFGVNGFDSRYNNLYCIEVDSAFYSNMFWTSKDAFSGFSSDCSNITLGCMNSLATNYLSFATLDNSNCIYNCDNEIIVITRSYTPWGYTTWNGAYYTITDSAGAIWNGGTCNDTIQIDTLCIPDGCNYTVNLFNVSPFGGCYFVLWEILDMNGDTLAQNPSCNGLNNMNYTVPFCVGGVTGVIDVSVKATKKVLIKVVDILGRETKPVINTPLFYIYDDGKVEKKIIVE